MDEGVRIYEYTMTPAISKEMHRVGDMIHRDICRKDPECRIAKLPPHTGAFRIFFRENVIFLAIDPLDDPRRSNMYYPAPIPPFEDREALIAKVLDKNDHELMLDVSKWDLVRAIRALLSPDTPYIGSQGGSYNEMKEAENREKEHDRE